MDFTEYGALIREHRKKFGLTQQQLAESCGMSRVTISQIETGAVPEIGVRKLSRLCARVNLDVQIVPMRLPAWDDLSREARARRTESLHRTSAIIAGLGKKTGGKQP